ncbi:ABC transporter ATP-binding protein [Terracidiphilus gabretensis]|uniref:ABC transporter ATP-binding protein n=1 Tax=Terracidiphilus gabretensis TaxID=1577687 RepID=UPI00071BFA0C|nr:ATP-binding cassette domain-containing protein [Terracidiphilus gabretensis]
MVDCSFDLRRGGFHLRIACRFASEWTVIFGPSGAGKSTLLRMLAGLERGGAARIGVEDKEVADLPAGRRRIGLLTQQAALFPHLSVSANVSYGLHGMTREARSVRVKEMLELVEAKNLADHRISDLSGGEVQRVALARALAPMPRLLLLDEPFSALDGKASNELLMRLQPWLRERNIQVIQATHDATDAFLTNAEVVLLQDGQIVAQGPAFEVLQTERERLTRNLSAAQKSAS